MVHRIESMNAFIACQQEKCDEKNKEINLFTICEICGSVQELLSNGLKNIVKSLSKDNNFLLKNSVLIRHDTSCFQQFCSVSFIFRSIHKNIK